MDGLGNKDKNRNFNVIDLEGLSDQCHQVLIFGLQHAGMTWGAAYQWGALLMECDSDPQQVRSTPKNRCSALLSTRSAHWVRCWLAVEMGMSRILDLEEKHVKWTKVFKESKIKTKPKPNPSRWEWDLQRNSWWSVICAEFMWLSHWVYLRVFGDIVDIYLQLKIKEKDCQ